MATYHYRLVNVFAEEPLGGNPLCVFEDGAALSDAQMQAIALQFNLSETTFIQPSSCATARIRIFTPTFELPFAGHPTLGSAHVVRELTDCGDKVLLETKAGVIPVTARQDRWTLRANPPSVRPLQASSAQLAAMLAVGAREVLEPALWVNTGTEQAVIPLASPAAVRRCQPKPMLMEAHARNAEGNYRAYVWAWQPDGSVLARYFFPKHGGIAEDPGTGSACANLGGWLLANNYPLPISLELQQGEAVGRNSKLHLDVTVDREILVSGNVIELGGGAIHL